MDLFKLIPENFFSLLTSKNKQIYAGLLFETFNVYEKAGISGVEKKIIVDDLMHYLDTNSYSYENEDLADDESAVSDNRMLANYFLKRLEQTGWIYIEVSHDYEEMLYFTNAGITMCEALLSLVGNHEENIEQTVSYETTNYQGYVYTIYSLLYNNDNIDYSFIFKEVNHNTKLLVRSIQKLDSNVKDYISKVFDQVEVKDLMENLMSFKENIVDKGYARLKMSDNINRYRIRIVTRLEEYLSNNEIMDSIANLYPNLETAEAYQTIARDIDEIIDTFNSLEDYILEIDNKSRIYINSTIAKIKFLTSEDDNVIGKLNRILRYIKTANKNDSVEKAIKEVNKIMHLQSKRMLSEKGLYVPRGGYKRTFNQFLDSENKLTDFDFESDFFNAYKAPYQESDVRAYLDFNMNNYELRGSDVITLETSLDDAMRVIYCIFLALENVNEFDITILDNRIINKYLSMRDFIIRKKVEVNA